MDTSHVFKRFHRQINLSEVGWEGQMKLHNARVTIVGAGGLGCPVLQYLTSCGVGTINIIDDDKVDISNLHRQILFTSVDIGEYKASVAAGKLKSLNEHTNIAYSTDRLTSENAGTLLSNCDIIVDATDNFATRYLLSDYTESINIPLVYGAIQGFQGQVTVFNYQGSPTYRMIYPEEGMYPVITCADNGILGIVPGIVGAFMANEVLKLILNFPVNELLVNRLLVYDFKNHVQNLIDLS
jgi:sulfur-carrier protein adenylyltransferase/sulfurtransferase